MIDRIIGAGVRARRLAHSSPVAIGLLVGANLVPLFGVLFLGWDLGLILTLYWLENGVVGVVNIAKIALAGAAGSHTSAASKAYSMFAFTIHYGLFWFVHGVFVVGITDLSHGLHVMSGAFVVLGFPILVPGLDPLTLIVAVLWLAIGQVASFVIDFIGEGEYRTVTVSDQVWAPYGRVITLHLAILGGAFAIAALGGSAGPVAILVLVKIALELGLYMRERRKATARVASSPLPLA